MKQTLHAEDAVKLKAENILATIKANKQALQDIEAQYKEEVEAVKAKYYKHLEAIKQDIRQAEEELQRFALKHKYELFRGDIAELNSGRLILQVKKAVKRVRGMLERLEELGWTEAIIVEKKVNWDEIEKWTDERLIALGTERIVKETVTYELK
ncbi:MAG: host-nuclease inhibitor Gam family protein [Hydrogenobacter thermophilus]|nr:host-nuclease inhibitor Gam family protein [Hydrogenobacter thermophilus]